MHIVEVVPELDVGGAQRVAALLAREFAARGHRVDVISLFDRTGSWIERELDETPGVALTFLGKQPGLDPRMVGRLARVLRRLRPDVVHTHLHTVKYVFPALPPRHRPAAFHTLHNLAEHEIERSGQLAHHVAFRLGVHPVAIGDAVARSIEALYGLCPAATIPNGIPVAQYRSPPGVRAAVRAELGIGEGQRVFLSAGRLNPQKNHALLLAAFGDLLAAAPGASVAPDPGHSGEGRTGEGRGADEGGRAGEGRGADEGRRTGEGRGAGDVLLIAGEGELRPELERQAAALPAGSVRLLGVRKDMARLLAAADAFVLPSRWEGNPMVVMEAMAAGTPVVATDVGCVRELVDARSGRVVAEGDRAALTAAMAGLSIDVCQELGAEASRVATARFDAGRMAEGYLGVFGATP